MSTKSSKDGWSPYLAGALAGLLAIVSAWATTHWLGKTSYLGTSTTFVRAAGYIQQAVMPKFVQQSSYYQAHPPKLDWQFMMVVGIFVGALLAALTDKSFQWQAVPPYWQQQFGSSVIKRAIGGFVGGILIIIGVRLADGCPSGHGLSGLMQLSVSGLVAMAVFFGSAVIIAHLIYSKKAKKGD